MPHCIGYCTVLVWILALFVAMCILYIVGIFVNSIDEILAMRCNDEKEKRLLSLPATANQPAASMTHCIALGIAERNGHIVQLQLQSHSHKQ